MQLFKYRVPPDDAEIFDARSRRRPLCAENYSERILLSGSPLYLDKPGRAYNWTPLASVLSRKRSRTRLIRFLIRYQRQTLLCERQLVILSGAKISDYQFGLTKSDDPRRSLCST